MKYKIGDRVRVRQNEKELFKFVTIKGQVTDYGYVVKENANVYTDEMLGGLYEEPVDYSKVSALEFLEKTRKICKQGYCNDCKLNGKCVFNNFSFSDDIQHEEMIIKATIDYEIPKQPILTDSEREYLSAVIKPFRDDVKWICKRANGDTSRILIGITNWEIKFPNFGSSEHYQGLEQDREYTLEELGL